MSDVKVVSVRSRTTDTGLEVEVSLMRSSWNVIVGPGVVRPEDVPQDVRDALSIWLAGNQ